MGHTEARFTSYLKFPPASACRSASAHTPISRTVVRTEYVVMSFPVRLLAISRCLFLLRWLRVYICEVCASCEALDLTGAIITLLLSILLFPPRVTLVSPFGLYIV
jgi:hypothetical protein